MPRRETELRIWPSDVAAQLEPMLWRAVPRNTAPSQMKSLGLLSGSEIAGAHESLLCWLWKYCVQHHCSRKCKSHGLSCTRWRMLRTHNLMPRQSYFGGQQRGFSLSGEGCSTGILLYIGSKDETICNETNLDNYLWTNLSHKQRYQGLSINIRDGWTLKCPAQMLPMTLMSKKDFPV